MTRLLVLFAKEWDVLHFRRWPDPGLRVYYEGFDLFSFPGNARLLRFDLFAFVERLAAKYRRIGIDAVLSNNEQFGALAAALLAARLGLPGASPNALITAQHKYYAREALKPHVPELLPSYCVFPYDLKSTAEMPLAFPIFVKPVKATFSVLARRIESFAELKAHLSFAPLERFLIKRLVKPFNDAMAVITGFKIDAHHLIGESILTGRQLSVDGYAIGGTPRILGVVEATMYPGTSAFLRFDYPAPISPGLRSRLHSATRAVIRGLGFDHGFFNVEFMVEPATERISLIEVNPRMASQFSDLYRKVEGNSLHELALQVSRGETPPTLEARGSCRHAVSYVFRRFDGTAAVRPTALQVRALADCDRDVHLMLYLKRGRALAREMKWLGSHRYAVLNMGGDSSAGLDAKIARASGILGFDAQRRQCA